MGSVVVIVYSSSFTRVLILSVGVSLRAYPFLALLIKHLAPHFNFDIADSVGLPCGISVSSGLFSSQLLYQLLFESISFVLVIYFLGDIVLIVVFFLVSALDHGD